MKRGWLFLIVLSAFLGVQAQSLPPVSKPDTSDISVSLEIDLPKLQSSINKNLNGVLYDDNSLDGDNLMIRLTKSDQIRFQVRGNQIDYTLPLKVWVKTGFKKSLFGVLLEDYYEAEGIIELQARTQLLITRKWNLQPQTQILSYRWIEEPKLNISGFKLTVTTISDLAFSYGKDKMNGMIDQAIRDNLNLRKYVEQVWSDVQNPMLVNSEHQIWLRITPLQVSLSPFVSTPDKLAFNVGMKSVIESSIGEKLPPSVRRTQLADLQSHVSNVSECIIFTIADINYAKLEDLARKEMIGKTFTQGKKSITIKEIRIFGIQNKLQVEALVEGSVKGKLIFTGIPVFDNIEKQLVINDFDFDITTKNLLVKSASWIMHNKLLSMMKPMLNYSFKEDIDELLIAFNKSMSAYPLSKGITLQGQILNYNLDRVSVGEKSVKIGGDIKAIIKIESGDL
ncbi:MAG: DUF4403 family protein [Bacteroidales bacterium]